MKKKTVMIISIVLLTVGVLGIGIRLVFSYYDNKYDYFSIEEGYDIFATDIYFKSAMDEFPSDLIVDPIESASQARDEAEKIWIDIFGDGVGFNIIAQRPYEAFYDEENGIWWVKGTLHNNGFGGVANILIEENGRVLAVWHEK